MRKSLSLLLLLPVMAFSTTVLADDDKPPLTGEEVMRLVRYSNALQDYEFTGILTNKATKRREGFRLRMVDGAIRFVFGNPPQAIHLELKHDRAELREVVKGSNALVPAERLGQTVRGTDMNYEDLSMRFLYWPRPTIEREERVLSQKCWRILVYAPDARSPSGPKGPYIAVRVWVDQGSGGILKMEAYDKAGKIVKRFEVKKGQKVDGTWILKQMRVESFRSGETKASGLTYLELNDPIKRPE